MHNLPSIVSVIDMEFIQISIIHDNICGLIQLEFRYIWIYAWILDNSNREYDIH